MTSDLLYLYHSLSLSSFRFSFQFVLYKCSVMSCWAPYCGLSQSGKNTYSTFSLDVQNSWNRNSSDWDDYHYHNCQPNSINKIIYRHVLNPNRVVLIGWWRGRGGGSLLVKLLWSKEECSKKPKSMGILFYTRHIFILKFE